MTMHCALCKQPLPPEEELRLREEKAAAERKKKADALWSELYPRGIRDSIVCFCSSLLLAALVIVIGVLGGFRSGAVVVISACIGLFGIWGSLEIQTRKEKKFRKKFAKEHPEEHEELFGRIANY